LAPAQVIPEFLIVARLCAWSEAALENCVAQHTEMDGCADT
jgi:hypothetical protein